MYFGCVAEMKDVDWERRRKWDHADMMLTSCIYTSFTHLWKEGIELLVKLRACVVTRTLYVYLKIKLICYFLFWHLISVTLHLNILVLLLNDVKISFFFFFFVFWNNTERILIFYDFFVSTLMGL